jgi:hypothetical protein
LAGNPILTQSSTKWLAKAERSIKFRNRLREA